MKINCICIGFAFVLIVALVKVQQKGDPGAATSLENDARMFHHLPKFSQLPADKNLNDFCSSHISKWKLSANADNRVALYLLANCYHFGYGVPKDAEKSIDYLMKSAERGYPMAKLDIGYYYNNLNKFRAGFFWFKEADEDGVPEAAQMIGTAYESGRGIKWDFDKAYNWYQKALSHGSRGADQAIDDFLMSKNAIYWVFEKAESGDHFAEYAMARRFQGGLGVPKDPKEAVKWYEKSAKSGFTPAISGLGYCYDSGIGVKQNIETAFALYKKAALGGDLGAEHTLGGYYRQGQGCKTDNHLAFLCFHKAAIGRFSKAYCDLGNCYLRGIGTPVDKKLGFEWSKASAKAGDEDGMAQLGTCYMNGWGVKKDPSQAFFLLKRAAEKGSVTGMRCLGTCYVNGDGVDVNYEEGGKWLRKAADAGSYTAAKLLKKIIYSSKESKANAILLPYVNLTINPIMKGLHFESKKRFPNGDAQFSFSNPQKNIYSTLTIYKAPKGTVGPQLATTPSSSKPGNAIKLELGTQSKSFIAEYNRMIKSIEKQFHLKFANKGQLPVVKQSKATNGTPTPVAYMATFTGNGDLKGEQYKGVPWRWVMRFYAVNGYFIKIHVEAPAGTELDKISQELHNAINWSPK